MSSVAPGLRLTEISKSFRQGTSKLTILSSAELEVKAGEMVALVGPSGAGKSTLLQIAGLLEKPDSGEVVIGGMATAKLRDGKRTALRRSMIGFVYQYHHLLPEFSALENVVIPQMITARPRREARERAKDLLVKVRLAERLDHRPAKLSGGEQQRVAIARALANRPRLLLADEPTGNLDPNTADGVFDLLRSLVEQEGVAALIATHNYDLAERMDRSLRLEEGKVVAVKTGPIDIVEALGKIHEEPAAESDSKKILESVVSGKLDKGSAGAPVAKDAELGHSQTPDFKGDKVPKLEDEKQDKSPDKTGAEATAKKDAKS